MTRKSWMLQQIWATADSAVVNAGAGSMNAPVRPSIILSSRPISCFRSSSSDLLFKLSLRDLVRMFLMRGYEFTHEAVREWEERFAPLLAEQLRCKRKGKVGRRWYVDETYVKVKGQMVLFVSCDRSRRQSGGLDAQCDAGYGGGPAVLPWRCSPFQ